MFQTFFAQLASLNQAVPQLPPSNAVDTGRVSKGIRAYPDGWRRALNDAKVTVRSVILLKQPFPSTGDARISVIEVFHEAQMAICDSGVVLEHGTFIPPRFTSL
jgi:hypothetical protein